MGLEISEIIFIETKNCINQFHNPLDMHELKITGKRASLLHSTITKLLQGRKTSHLHSTITWTYGLNKRKNLYWDEMYWNVNLIECIFCNNWKTEIFLLHNGIVSSEWTKSTQLNAYSSKVFPIRLLRSYCCRQPKYLKVVGIIWKFNFWNKVYKNNNWLK